MMYLPYWQLPWKRHERRTFTPSQINVEQIISNGMNRKLFSQTPREPDRTYADQRQRERMPITWRDVDQNTWFYNGNVLGGEPFILICCVNLYVNRYNNAFKEKQIF